MLSGWVRVRLEVFLFFPLFFSLSDLCAICFQSLFVGVDYFGLLGGGGSGRVEGREKGCGGFF
jgi:hypothetical protein